jgi:hypothetical protein
MFKSSHKLILTSYKRTLFLLLLHKAAAIIQSLQNQLVIPNSHSISNRNMIRIALWTCTKVWMLSLNKQKNGRSEKEPTRMINLNSRIGQGSLRKRKRRRKTRSRSFLILAKMIVKTLKLTTLFMATIKIAPTVKIISTRTTQTMASNKCKIRTKNK